MIEAAMQQMNNVAVGTVIADTEEETEPEEDPDERSES